LVCVGAGLILSGQWLGLIPDANRLEMRARSQRCETIAVAAAAMIRGGQWSQLEAILQATANRDEGLLSVGVRSQSGQLRVDSGRHRDLWRKALKDNSLLTVHVPITLNRNHWGQVEYCFLAPEGGGMFSFIHHPTVRLLTYFFGAGLCIYTFFVARVMGLFDSVQVVPDRVRQALDTLAEGLLVLDESEKIILANRAFSETVGISPELLAGRAAGSLNWVSDEKDGTNDFPWSRAIVSSRPQTEQMLRYRLNDERDCIFSINSAPIQATDGCHRGALVTLRDVTHVEEHRAELETMLAMLRSSRDEISRKNRELEILATQDALTGCLNRRAFFERFAVAFRFSHQTGSPLSCVMVDNDHFKSVNDTYGHHVGDEVLRQVARTLHELHREAHLVCRYGGEEFCILLPGFELHEAAEAAERIRLAIMGIRLSDPAELRLTASLGVSELSSGAQNPQEMINQADTCLYIAKRQGRNQVVCYDSSMESIEIDDTKVSRTKPEKAVAAEEAAIPFNAVSALVSALAYRDPDTAEHSRRVADICVRVAEGLLDQRQIFVLETAALLHDIGKIGVPDHILLKPGPLTQEEWKVMSQHDRIGVEIISSAFNCPELSEAVKTHHSFFGGHGRDQSLPKGRDIPIYARILSIADSYDAMVSDRVYRKGRTHEEAIAELRRCAGTQFDPELVERFIEISGCDARTVNHQTMVVPKAMAIQIGQQIESLANAIDMQDTASLQVLATRLGDVARRHHVNAIAEAADRIGAGASEENVQWMILLRDTQQLMELCRASQNAFLSDATNQVAAQNSIFVDP
jgi:diguanylate cyclase (GGDEF)-like protein/PAS domain S-box-containing protein/putative nucleotidyltransferase with HDIG domain